jgi:hypothetical protein
MGAYIFDVF